MASNVGGPRFVMLGGFLGAGKTTTVLRAAQYFQRKGKRVGLITNDQAAGLVDTTLIEELNLPVLEIVGGCFCCKSESLVDALGRLTAESQPEVFIAEPVGSCTDLIATVSLPLQHIYKQGYAMAPYAVLLDPYRAMQTLGVEGVPLFSPDVNYIYRKQLEEAELIVINKVDVMSPERLVRLRDALRAEYPGVPVIEVASRPGLGMEPLLEALASQTSSVKQVMDVDYARYGIGEALLGWVNLQARLTRKRGRKEKNQNAPASNSATPFTAEEWLLRVTKNVQQRIRRRRIEIAHWKASIADSQGQVTAVQLVSSSGEPEVTVRGVSGLEDTEFRINLRAEGDPDVLLSIVLKTLANCIEASGYLDIESLHSTHFRPGQPKPTHRVTNLD